MHFNEYIKPLPGSNIFRGEYLVTKDIIYYSKRYNKYITVKTGEVLDGATGALDIDSFGWPIHDMLCKYGKFDDGTPCNNLQASLILSDILREEKRYIRSLTWLTATWLFGGGKARKNGMY